MPRKSLPIEEKRQRQREAVKKCRLLRRLDPTKKEEDRIKRNAYAANNRSKLKEIDKKSYQKRRDKILKRQAAYASKNQDSILAYQAEYRNEHRDTAKSYRQQYQKDHAGQMVEYKIRRKIRLKKSILTNEHLAEIEKIYQAKPKNTVIDHIIPLQGKNVSGLHVPWNLQYLSVEENNFKRHSFDNTYNNDDWKKRFNSK